MGDSGNAEKSGTTAILFWKLLCCWFFDSWHFIFDSSRVCVTACLSNRATTEVVHPRRDEDPFETQPRSVRLKWNEWWRRVRGLTGDEEIFPGDTGLTLPPVIELLPRRLNRQAQKPALLMPSWSPELGTCWKLHSSFRTAAYTYQIVYVHDRHLEAKIQRNIWWHCCLLALYGLCVVQTILKCVLQSLAHYHLEKHKETTIRCCSLRYTHDNNLMQQFD